MSLRAPVRLGVGVLAADAVTSWVQGISGPWLYAVAFVMTFAETGTLLFFVPGEVTLVVAGVGAGAGGLDLRLMVAIAVTGALAGDACGFWIGRRYGTRLERSALGRKIGTDGWERAQDLIRRRRGAVILLGRWVGVLRAVMPASAGMSGMAYREAFLPWDLPGAASWAALCVLGGYWMGEDAEALVTRIGTVAGAVVAVVAAVAVVKVLLARRRDT